MKKHFTVLGLICALLVCTAPAMAANVVLLDVDITGLAGFDVGAFDLDVSFDPEVYEFHHYDLTDALGSISLGDADDWSYGHYADGYVNIAALSYLIDLGYQPSEFTLATLVFSKDDAITALNTFSSDFDLIINDLSDANGDPIPFSVNGTRINAIPLPAAAWLLGSGLICFIGIRGRERS